MGGKKKTLANKLARMTDEERARYLQHKADIEEEARRRKEQLVSIFLKNKIKKEDGFSRLNLAKINQQWHQILRFNKCKEMKEDVEHMKKHIDRVLAYKNRTIQLLLDELVMAEEQYAHNFQAHVTHIDQTIDSHQDYLILMEDQYHQDLDELIESSTKEQKELLENAYRQHEHLKTVIFAEAATFKARSKEDHERYLKMKEEVTSTFRTKLDAFIKQRECLIGALWRQIAAITKAHVQQTDKRRLHLAELKRLDAESAAEIAANQERITSQEEEIKALACQYENLKLARDDEIKKLTKKLKTDTEDLFGKRQQFRKEIYNDEKKLILLTDVSNKSMEFLQKLHRKGSQIINLMLTCRKFETPREQISKWLPLCPSTDDVLEETRPSTSKNEEMVKKIVISTKSLSSSSSSVGDVDNITNQYAALLNLENFWLIYNKVAVEFKELKQEKKILTQQNKQIRGMIRAALEAAVLDQTVPTSKISTRVASKSRSAPLRRIII